MTKEKPFLKRIKEIIYPYHNGTAVWYKRTRWDVNCGDVIYYFYNWEVIRLLELLAEDKK